MVIVDTSAWVAHLREGVEHLAEVLNAGQAVCHPFALGELACGNLVNRTTVLGLLNMDVGQAATGGRG